MVPQKIDYSDASKEWLLLLQLLSCKHLARSDPHPSLVGFNPASSLPQQVPGGSQSPTCVLLTSPYKKDGNNGNPGVYLLNKHPHCKHAAMLLFFPISPLRDTPPPVVVCRQLPKCWAGLVQNLLQFGWILTTPGWYRRCTGKDDSCGVWDWFFPPHNLSFYIIYLITFSNNSVWIKFSASADQYCLRWQPESRKAIPGINIRALQWKTKVNRQQYESTSGFTITRVLDWDWLFAKLPFFLALQRLCH